DGSRAYSVSSVTTRVAPVGAAGASASVTTRVAPVGAAGASTTTASGTTRSDGIVSVSGATMASGAAGAREMGDASRRGRAWAGTASASVVSTASTEPPMERTETGDIAAQRTRAACTSSMRIRGVWSDEDGRLSPRCHRRAAGRSRACAPGRRTSETRRRSARAAPHDPRDCNDRDDTVDSRRVLAWCWSVLASSPPPAASLESALRRFGFDSFRPGQREAVETLLERRKLLLVAPTGGGKSLTYQLPAAILPGTALVISPLIALMHDQVASLQAMGIPATFLAATLPAEEIRARMAGILAGHFKLVYVAPERLAHGGFRNLLARLDVSLVAVDEAHCISEWGHDFRPEYLQIGQFIQSTEPPRILACTATATPIVRD